MKQVLVRIKVGDEVLNYILIFCFFIFPIFPFFASLSLIIFALVAVPYLDRLNFTKSKMLQYLLLNAVYIVYLIATLYSPNHERSLDLLIRLLPIPIITALYVFSNIVDRFNYSNIKNAYVGGVALASCIAILTASVKALQLSASETLFYFSLTKVIHAHPVYFSLQVLTCMVILLNTIKTKRKLTPVLLLTFFSVMIILLQSKSAFILMILLFVFNILHKGVRAYVKITLGVLAGIALITVFKTISSDNNRFSELFRNVDKIEIGSIEEDGIQQRKWLWTSAWEQYKDQPVFGYGLGSQRNIFQWKVEKSLLESKDLKGQNIRAAKVISKLNLHNQYLQLLYETGIFGAGLFIISCILLIIFYGRTATNSFVPVLILFLLFLITENMLDRQMGIYFYAFIIVFLLKEKTNKNRAKIVEV